MDKLLNDFSPGLFIMQTIILLIIILLMRKFAWKPILESLKLREEGIESAITMAEKARAEMLALEANNANLLKEARVERDAIIKDARETAQRMIEEVEAKAQVKANKLIENAQIAIANEKIAAIAELKTQMATFSIEIAEKIVKSELSSDEKQNTLANQLASEINLN